ncbi:MAG: hypothetical protein PUI16_00590 [Clostridia bacterium]|nr:hypothetical protein [Clostridia bacterium]MDY5554948.1 hypothetical protein [Blautia sp.]
MNHKITRKTSNEEIDHLLESKYMEEAELIESSLRKTQENRPFVKPYKESEEKIKEGYDKLVASLKRKEQYRYEICCKEKEKWEKNHKKIKMSGFILVFILFVLMFGMIEKTDMQSVCDTIKAIHMI